MSYFIGDNGRVVTLSYDIKIERRNADGDFHSETHPAIEFLDGYSYEWYFNGKLHRDGPAAVYASGAKL